MSWSLPIFRIAGIQLRIHITFLLLIAWLAFGYYAAGGSAAALGRVLFVLLLFVCVVLHEFGHAIAAKNFGINTPDITLLPIGGVARLQRMPDEPRQELIIALAGPLVNVVIALTLFAGISNGWGPGFACTPRHAIELCAGHANRRQHRPGLRIYFRFHRPFWKSTPHLHCPICVYGCVAGSGPRPTQRYFAQFSGFERDGARIPFASAKRHPPG